MSNRLNAPVQWYGGKGNMLAKLRPLIPYNQLYVEPYGGAGSVLLDREPSPVEIYNDLDDRLINLYRVLQDINQSVELERRIKATLYSYSEFGRAIEILKSSTECPIEKAWAFFVAQNQGFSGKAKTQGNWSRAFSSKRGHADTVNSWQMRQSLFPRWRERIEHVQIDGRDALTVLKYWDSKKTVFYCDPPYLHRTRSKGHCNIYAHEQDDTHHEKLVDLLLTLNGAVVISGYDTPIYSRMDDAGWVRTEFQTACHAAGRVRVSKLQGKGAALKHTSRTEIVWQNPRALEMLGNKEKQQSMF